MRTAPPAWWHDTDAPFPSDIPVTRLLDEAAVAHADAPALLAGPPGQPRIVHDYRGLRAEATRLARLLRRIGIRTGDHVGVLGRHRPETVVAVHGVLIAGAVYVPVDPRWPVARRRAVLEAVGARCVVADEPDLQWLAALPAVTDVVLPTASRHAPVAAWRAEVVSVWDSVSRSGDPLEAAGFNLSGGRLSAAEVARYARHVGGLVTERRPSGVLEIGFGSGLVLRELAGRVPLLSGLEPAPYAVAAAERWAVEHDVFADLAVGFADQVDDLLPGPHDVALLASTVQFFPDERYLHAVLDRLARVLPAGGTVVVADVIPPGAAPVPGLLEIAPEAFLGLRGPVWEDVEVRRRPAGDGWPPVLAARYDAILRRSAAPAPAAAAHQGRPRVWTGWHVAEEGDQPLPPQAGPDDTAYVIFTSGSTGTPKGVRVGHRSVVNLVGWINGKHRVGPGDQALQTTSFCFDLSVYDLVGVLSSGAALRMVDDADLAEPARLAQLLIAEPVTFWNSAPAALGWVLPFVTPGQGRLRLAFLSGDWIPLSMPDEIRAFAPGATVVNLGGATETTVWSNDFVVGDVDAGWASIPYGRPMPNSRYYVLDEALREVAVGEAGELYIAGTCLAQGYHEDPEHTRRAFLPDVRRPGERMYRTGDLARFRPDGVLELLGRLDHQVKIRGFRVELGEIEAVMSRLAGVRAATAVAVPVAGDRGLAAYYVRAAQGPGAEAVRAWCRQRLPDYMVPSLIDAVDAMPLTGNGKVDRAVLAETARATFAGGR